MKKSVIVLLVSLLVSGMVFAQATVNGYYRAMGTISEADFAGADRLRLNLGYLSDDKNVQFFARIQENNVQAGPPLAIPFAWGSIKLSDMVKVTGGLLGMYDYTITNDGYSDYILGKIRNDDWALDGKITAMLLQLYPVAGLNIGVTAAPLSEVKEIGMKNFGVNAKYDIAKVGSVVVQSVLGEDMETSQYSGSFKFTGVKDMWIAAGYKHTAADVASVYGIASYAAGAISGNVGAEFYLDDSALYIEGVVKYVTGPYTVQVLAGYDADGKKIPAEGDYLVGLEAYYNVGKGQLMAGFTYSDAKEWSIPLLVKVNF